MFDFRLLRIRSFTAANTAMFFIGAALGGMFLLVLFLVNVLGYTELQAAIAITPMPLTASSSRPTSAGSWTASGPGYRRPSAPCSSSSGSVLLAQLNGESTVWDATWRVIFLGAGIGFSHADLVRGGHGVAAAAGGGRRLRRPEHAAPGRASRVGLAVVVAIFSHTIVSGRTDGAPRRP